MICQHFHEFMTAQRGAMQHAIDENKWYLSEQARHDVGYKAAEMDFLEKHMTALAVQFRSNWCGGICEDRDGCKWRTHV